MSKKIYFGFLSMVFLFGFVILNGETVYIWDNENNAFYFPDPETGEFIDGSTAIGNILSELGIDYTRGFDLPGNPADYELIMAEMGSFCES